MPQHVMYVCTGCNFSKSSAERDGVRGGRILWDALCAETASRGASAVLLQPVACLSVCRDACAVALTAPHKYTLVFGGIAPAAASAAALLEVALRYRDSPDGHVDRQARPPELRRLIARIPPPQFDPDRDDDAGDPRMAKQVAKPPRPVTKP